MGEARDHVFVLVANGCNCLMSQITARDRERWECFVAAASRSSLLWQQHREAASIRTAMLAVADWLRDSGKPAVAVAVYNGLLASWDRWPRYDQVQYLASGCAW